MGILADWQIREANCIKPFAENQKRPGIISFGLSSYGYDARIGYKFKVFSPVNAKEIDPKNFNPDSLVDVDLSPFCQWSKIPFDNGAFGCLDCFSATNNPNVQEKCLDRTALPDHILIPPHSFALGETVEEFDIPRDCLAVVLGKSTYARCGIIVNVTPLEPEWKGKVTVEISNTTPLPVRIYAGEGIMQVLFFRSDGESRAVITALRETSKCRGNLDNIHTITHLMDTLTTKTCQTSYADKKGKYQGQDGLTLPTVDSHEKKE